MSLLNIIKDGIGGLVKPVGDIIDNLNTSEEEKLAAKQKLEELLQKERMQQEMTVRKELEAKERVLVAELQQGDAWTKRARPSVIYAGLAFVLIGHILLPLFQPETTISIPSDFWWGWTAIVSTYSIGRTVEKRGSQNRATNAATGSRKINLLD